MAIRIREGFQGQRSVELPKSVVEKEEGDPLVSSLFVTYIGYYPHAEHHYVDRTKPISEYVLIYCVEGRGHYIVKGNKHMVEQNQYFILPADESHLYWSDKDSPWTIYWVHFRGELAAYYSDGALTPQTIRPGFLSRISHRNEIFEEIFATLESGFEIDSLRYASSAFIYYLASMRFLLQYRSSKNLGKLRLLNPEIQSEEGLVEAATYYMQENIEHTLTLTDMARYIGYSEGHFSRVFKKVKGVSPLAFFNRMKISKACEMLRETNMRINQICYKVGIVDNLYFSRVFKRMMGMSPLEYRKHSPK